MSPPDTHLSQIATRWTLLLQAHGGEEDARTAALAQLLPRYVAPAYYYLLYRVRDEGLAEELCQEFALRFLRGRFRHADPLRGRFRDYLRVSLQSLVADYGRRQRAGPHPVPLDSELLDVVPGGEPDWDQRFQEIWRDELLRRVWSAVEEQSAAAGDRYFEVLWLRSERPGSPSAELAAELSRRHGRALTADWLRQTLSRARARFVDRLRQEVAQSIPTDDPDAVNAELAELGLLVYCPPADAS